MLRLNVELIHEYENCYYVSITTFRYSVVFHIVMRVGDWLNVRNCDDPVSIE